MMYLRNTFVLVHIFVRFFENDAYIDVEISAEFYAVRYGRMRNTTLYMIWDWRKYE